ncbi:hypothetical protein A2673_03345 [Candidatus Kaiserbacteria bacterium RIFCSPHIGHO2_01_FULL_50_13]|uniref:Amidophosphoribosyltransferase n=1 Tax=Candidatus Kaiserbacteria bacterium RIFCSPLOWO2_01_FULL_50_24 TaxID=1798507 RepID=A0A1F6EIR3_9BACT|nr:MAG: hypothetical protein A2673_03345 [Candidatus Kaiserbacteria bacterium RIFCSPHIGHO2_01_FULL_50_13]OGG73545.1 MAG: hypothetical protein A3A34_01185 [Candidatus Kaiserbacteria bacterium RIFCSPLOWO2_01_FULL_50_24]OGG81592.1 MAG: hypothetical protein A3H74_00720 [Candidatus Kaiserbacteria bacterium RIFCSPLOWO2_02_FULL_51_13]
MCGILAVFNMRKAAELTVIGLHSQQHRAIDYAGIVSSDGTFLYKECGPGTVRKVFTSEMLDRLHGKHALGHTRYPTLDDDPNRINIQPLRGYWRDMPIALAHNGNLTNTDELARICPHRKTSLDTEFILRILETRQEQRIEDALAETLRMLKGSFSLALLLPEMLIAARDPHGNRPLSVGVSEDIGFLVSSETCALSVLGAQSVYDVPPAAMVLIDRSGMRQISYTKIASPLKKCSFEGIYFVHPSSDVYGVQATTFRLALGRALEEHCPCPSANIVTEVPASGTLHAMGYATTGRSGMYMPVIFRNNYVGRTFIASSQSLRDEEVDAKFNFTKSLIVGKRIVVVDDSIVRGTTIRKIVSKLRELGALEVHVRVACPPVTHHCNYGIYTKGKDGRLIAQEMNVEEIREHIGADSIAFLPLGVLKEIWPDAENSCFSCMTGVYW